MSVHPIFLCCSPDFYQIKHLLNYVLLSAVTLSFTYAMTKNQCMVLHANVKLVSSSRDAAGSGSFRAGSDVCVYHLESTAGTSGGLQGKTTAAVQLHVRVPEGETAVEGCASLTFI